MFEGSIDYVDRLLLAWSFVSLVFFFIFLSSLQVQGFEGFKYVG